MNFVYSYVLLLTGTILSQSLGIPVSGEIPSLMLNPGPSPETSVKQKFSASSPNLEKADPLSCYQHPYPECF